MRTFLLYAQQRRWVGVLALMLVCQGVFFIGAKDAAAATDGNIQSTVKIAHGTVNGPVLADGDGYGPAAGIGDLDGDGARDMVAGASLDDTGGTDRGAVHVHFMNADGSIASTVKIASGTTNGPVLADGDRYGASVADIGDINNDGVRDIAVGASGDDTGGTNRGAVHIHFMNADGSIASTVKVASGTTNGPVLANGDQYGFSVTGIGDLNSDGVTDLAVGAISDDTGGTDRGAVHIHFMNADGSIVSTMKIASGTTNGPTLLDTDRYGSGVAALGDLDSDGVRDIAVGAISDDTDGVSSGAAYIHFLNANGTVKSIVKITSGTANGPALAAGDGYGRFGSLGDLDGDGLIDLGVGASGDSTGGAAGRGAVYLHFLRADGSMKRTVKIATGTTNGPVLSVDNYGGSIAALGDLNGDGTLDIAVSAASDDTGGTNRGATHLHFMRPIVFSGNPCPSSKITLVSPNGGETYQVGDTPLALWNVQGCQIERVTLRLSPDGGTTFSDTLLASTTSPQNGYVFWTASNTPTITARIEAELIGLGGVPLSRDQSDGDFIILPVTDTLLTDGATIIVDGTPSTPEAFDPGALIAEGLLLNVDDEIEAILVENPSCIPGTTIKGVTSRTVYHCAQDGSVRPFPDQATFLTWHHDFSRVITMSDAFVASLTKGPFVTARPGATLIKTPDNAAVYVVTANRTLRQLASEETASALYGLDWQREVIDVDPSFLSAYRMGEMIE